VCSAHYGSFVAVIIITIYIIIIIILCFLPKKTGLQTFHEHHVFVELFWAISYIMSSFVNPKCIINTTVCATLQNREEYWEALTLAGTFFPSCVSWTSQVERAN
jgi:hypothetical protein